ncbi:hypothetical protein WDU94_007850 [Cyamophila willieti]
MEECLFFQDIIDCLEKLQDFIDGCLSEQEPNDVTWKKQQTLTTITDRIISLMTRKDKAFQLLYARNKMLEARIKTIAHQLRAMDKMTQIPEVPSLFQIKEENSTLPDIEISQEEEIQLSVIPEITEIENSECKSSDNREDTICDNEKPATPRASNVPVNSKPPVESNLMQWREPPNTWQDPKNFETSTPKESMEAKRHENQRRRFFPTPSVIDNPVVKCSAQQTGEDTSKNINNPLIRQPTIEIGECSKSLAMNNPFNKRPMNTNGESCSSKNTNVKLKERYLTLEPYKKHLEMEIANKSVKEIKPNQNETITIKDNTEQTMYSDISSDEDISDESKKEKLKNKVDDERRDQESEGNTRKHEGIDLKSQDNTEQDEEALRGRRPIRFDKHLQNNEESTVDGHDTQSIETEKDENSEMDDIDENDIDDVDDVELPDDDDDELESEQKSGKTFYEEIHYGANL